MATVGISITKETAFRDNTQEFSNVYHYNGSATPSETSAEALIDALVTFEKSIHSSVVTFTHGRCWTAGGSPSTNNMITEKTLTGTGTGGAAVASMDRERAFLLQWEAGNDSRGHKVRLKKWYHTCAAWPGTTGISATQLQNTSGFTTADRNVIALKGQDITDLTAGGVVYRLSSKTARTAQVVQPTAHKYLEHHQLGDQWRG
jgi:hypothetical protein